MIRGAALPSLAPRRGPGTRVLVAAGEISGDALAAPVVRALRRRRPALSFFGTGGAELARAGVALRRHVDALAVTGLTEALPRLGVAAATLADLAWCSWRRRPGIALLVDYPGFNLRLAAVLRRLGVPVLLLVAPQRWAWLAGRARRLADRVDRLVVTLPFEPAWFAAQGVAATFVGHPLVDRFAPLPRAAARRALGLPSSGRRLVALLPGSRANEVRRHLPVMLAAVGLAGQPLDPLLVVAEGAQRRLCRELAGDLPVAGAELALGGADLAICASGTATLECALAGVPAVVLYRTSGATFVAGQQLLNVSMLALPNLILGRRLVPELVQHDASPARIAAALDGVLEPARAAEIRAGYREVAAALRAQPRAVPTRDPEAEGDLERPLARGPHSPGVADRVADLALGLLDRFNPC